MPLGKASRQLCFAYATKSIKNKDSASRVARKEIPLELGPVGGSFDKIVRSGYMLKAERYLDRMAD